MNVRSGFRVSVVYSLLTFIGAPNNAALLAVTCSYQRTTYLRVIAKTDLTCLTDGIAEMHFMYHWVLAIVNYEEDCTVLPVMPVAFHMHLQVATSFSRWRLQRKKTQKNIKTSNGRAQALFFMHTQTVGAVSLKMHTCKRFSGHQSKKLLKVIPNPSPYYR